MMRRLLCATALALTLPTAVGAEPLRDQVAAEMPALLDLYRTLHAAPELSFEEVKSAALLAAAAKKAGFEVTTGVGRTGVVAVLRNGPGPVVLLRADMDALPLVEKTGLPFASTAKAATREGQETGVMHACGHDTHMAAWVGTARAMAALRDRWSGTLVMVAQPAEELGLGAKAMLDDGLYTRFPKPQYAVAFHDSASLPAGTIASGPGYAMANVDSVDVLVKGVGGHGAYPHLARDPVVLAARIVGALQTLVSREVDPQDAGVVTVGSIQAGTKHNIIPDEARLMLTVRSYTPVVRRTLLDGIARIARGEAIAAGMPDDRMPVVTARDGTTPAVLNTDPVATRLSDVFKARFGAERVVPVKPQMGGEDFSHFRLADEQNVQSLLFWVGGVPKEKWDAAKGDITKLASIHSPFWAPDADAVIRTATEAMTAAALELLAKG